MVLLELLMLLLPELLLGQRRRGGGGVRERRRGVAEGELVVMGEVGEGGRGGRGKGLELRVVVVEGFGLGVELGAALEGKMVL